jgi:hypothetical protein
VREIFRAANTLGRWQAIACSAVGEESVSPAKCKPTASLVSGLYQIEPESPPELISSLPGFLSLMEEIMKPSIVISPTGYEIL